jgi:hypothetical protein
VNTLPKDVLGSQCAVSRFESVTPSFMSHALTVRPPHILLLEVFSAAGRKRRVRDCLNLCPKCTETTCIFQFKKFSGVIYHRTPVLKGRGGKAKGRV